ncbi:MAG: FMN-binding protein, partial [Thiomonas sp.]
MTNWQAHALLPLTVLVASPAYATEYLTVAQAQKAIFPDAERFVAAPLQLTAQQKAAIEDTSGVKQRWDRQEVWRAEKGGRLLG